MKTIEQVINEYKSETIDGRDLNRLADFLTVDQAANFGLEFKDEYKETHKPIEFSKENILKQLKNDVEFGFEKALDQRGISASMMYEVVSMCNWILEEGLEDHSTPYAQYGLPLLKATAIKYDFENPIGEDIGNEPKYACA